MCGVLLGRSRRAIAALADVAIAGRRWAVLWLWLAAFSATLPIHAFAQPGVTSEEDIANTAAYYTDEMKAAAQACDRTRYDRAFLGLRGVLGQIDSDIRNAQANLKREQEIYESKRVALLNMTFGSRQEQEQFYANVRSIMNSYRREIARLTLLRKDVTNRMNNRPPFRCSTETGFVPPVGPRFGIESLYASAAFEPKIAIGGGGSTGTPSYVSTGPQEPFSGSSSSLPGHGALCGGATFYPGLGFPARVGLDLSICTGSKTLGSGDTTLFTIQRHGPGDVRLDATTRMLLDALIKAELPVGPANGIFLSAGVGPSFRQMNLTLTSDQTFFGGGVPSITQTTWQTGVGVSAGVAMLTCANCIAGNPLKVGVEGRARFFPSASVDLRSPTFGFVETGSTGRTTEYGGVLTFGVPLTFSDARLKRDVVRVGRLDNGIALYRYRYRWSDEIYVGVMAQEVTQAIPEAVVRGADGYLRVAYGRIGWRLMTWEEWTALEAARSPAESLRPAP